MTLPFIGELSSIGEGLRYAVGGVMVGMGYTLGSINDLFALIFGAWVGMKLQANFMDDHEVPKCDN